MKKSIIFIAIFLSIKLLSAQDRELAFQDLKFSTIPEDAYITAPTISFDGNYLSFVVKKDDNYKFYECKKTGETWSEPQEITAIDTFLSNNIYKNSPAYNYDASKLYFAAMNGTNTDIFYCQRTPNGWTTPTLLPKTINTQLNEDEPSISTNDKILFFVRFEDEKDKECGTIYRTRKNKKFQWNTPEPLIDPLNSGCERTPRILSDNKTLLFASKRDKEKDFSIYYAKNVFQEFWLLPEKIGRIEKNNNLYPCVDYNAKKIILSVSNNKKSRLVVADLPKKFAPSPTKIITGKITDEHNNPISATISLLNPTSIETVGLYENNPKTGEYFIFVPPKSKYIIDFSAENYSHTYYNYNNFDNKKLFDTIEAKLFDSVFLKLNVFDKDIFEPMNVEFQVFDNQTDTQVKFNKQQLDKGRYILRLPIGKNYKIQMTSEFIHPYSLNIDLSGVVIFKTFEKNVEITSEKATYTFKVLDKETKAGISCQVVLTNLNTSKKVVTTVKTNEKGEVQVFVRKGDIYDITINPQGYAFYSTQFSVVSNENHSETVELQPLKQDTKIELQNITFETNSADLNINSYNELNKVIELMEKNPEIKVEISAHTDDIGTEQYNMNLSERRAKSVVDYLINHDVPKNRLIAKGYGETQPLVPNTSDENRAINRRVELKIIDTNQ
jgi:outer membrane protein OmpA-like peptidoglycan-associated protein